MQNNSSIGGIVSIAGEPIGSWFNPCKKPERSEILKRVPGIKRNDMNEGFVTVFQFECGMERLSEMQHVCYASFTTQE